MNAYEIAKKLNVTHTTIYRWVDEGCPYTEIQKGTMTVKQFDLQEVQRWIGEQKKKG